MPNKRPILVVMVKEPRLGRVKSRLARDIGVVRATWWYRHQLDRLLRKICGPAWDVVLAVSPNPAVTSRMFPFRLAKVEQGGGDLGDRMARQLANFAPRPVLVVGSDIPGISRRNIAATLKLLSRNDFVFGPAPDGGYWCVGARNSRALPPNLFSGVHWSSETALSDSLASLAGQSVALGDELNDVDTAKDLIDDTFPKTPIDARVRSNI